MTSQTLHRIVLASIIAASLGTTARGQGGPGGSWNRRIEAVTLLPDATGGLQLQIFLGVEAEGLSATTDLSSEIVIHRDGVPIEIVALNATAAGNGCGAGQCATFENCICCEIGGQIECFCGSFIAPIPAQSSFVPGDEIMVLLRPAPGAVPETDPSDDMRVIHFNGDSIFWNRRIESIEALPAGGPAANAPDSFFDIFVDVAVEANYQGLLRTPVELELQINGATAGTNGFPALDLDYQWNQCANVACDDTVACVMSNSGPTFGSCQPAEDSCQCLLHPVPDMIFPGVALEPGDIITVILRPAPGVLPELPGFGDDDEQSTDIPGGCPADTDGTGIVDVDDLVNVILDWGCTNPPGPCPGDVTGNGVVDVDDLVAVILGWGPCFPV